jgi:hypothetical protein
MVRKIVRCKICHHPLKKRKYRKAGMGPRCAELFKAGFSGIQLAIPGTEKKY